MRATQVQERNLKTQISWKVLAPDMALPTMSADKSLDVGFNDNIPDWALYIFDIIKI